MLTLATEASELMRQRRYTESRAAFLRLTNLPLFADQGYLGLGMVALCNGDPHAARWHFLHALRCNPCYALAHTALEQLERSQPRAGTTRPGGWRPGSVASDLTSASGRHAFGRQPASTRTGGGPTGHGPAGPGTAARGPAGPWPAGPGPAGPGPAGPGSAGPGSAGRGPARVAELGSYEYLRSDTSLLGQHITAALAALPGRQRGSVLAHAGRLIALAIMLCVLVGAAIGACRVLRIEVAEPTLWAFGGLIWCIAVLRIRTTVHDLSGGRLTIRHGLLRRRVTQLELCRVRSIERRRTLLDRITGHAELRFTADTPDRHVLRARGLARHDRLCALHATLSDLVFLLHSSPPATAPR